MARGLTSAGATRHDTVQVSYGYGLFTGGLGAHQGAERIGATVVPTSSGNTKRQIMLMQGLWQQCAVLHAVVCAADRRDDT